MARKKTPSQTVEVKQAIAERLREIRRELYGDRGGPELARRLGLPARVWYNYESGVTVPAEVLLGFADVTGVNLNWLVSGKGERYVKHRDENAEQNLSPVEIIRRALERIENESGGAPVVVAPPAELVRIPIIQLERIGDADLASAAVEGEFLAFRPWVTNPSQTVAVRVPDEAMHPVLPAGSVAAVDRSVTDPRELQGKIVVANPEGAPLIRWLEISGRHTILRPNLPGRDRPMIPFEIQPQGPSPIVGQVICSWNRLLDV